MRVLKSLEKGFKNLFFAASRIYLKKGRGGFEPIDPRKIKRVLFIRPEKLGDMVISLPVFYNLKKSFPHIEIYTICSPRNFAIIRDDASLSGNFLYTKNIFHDFKMMRRVRRLGFDVVADMVCDDSVTALFLTQYASPRARRIGLGKNRHRDYYDFNYKYRTDDKAHVLDNTVKLLDAFGIDLDTIERHVPPTISEEHFEKTAKFIASLNSNQPEKIIGLNISAGRPTRVWPFENNRELIALILENYPEHSVIISADPKERERAVELAARFSSRVAPIPEMLSLLEVSAIISRLRLLITPDTSLVHIARAFKVPVVGLYTRFGRNFEMWRPYNQKTGAVISGNDYNIFDIEVAAVFDTVKELLPPGVNQ